MANPTGSPTSVYRYYDRLGILIYVGMTASGILRNRQHNDDKEWWPLVCKQEVDHYESREIAVAQESGLIRRHRPPFNHQHNPDHRLHKETYLALVGSDSHRVNLALVVGQKTRRIDLDIANHDPRTGELTLRSRVADAAVVTSLVDRAGVAILAPGGRQIGVVGDIQKAGPFVQIHAKSLRRGLVFASARGFIKRLQQKGPVVSVIRHIELSM